MDLKKDSDAEDIEYGEQAVVQKYQFEYDMTTCMLPKYP